MDIRSKDDLFAVAKNAVIITAVLVAAPAYAIISYF